MTTTEPVAQTPTERAEGIPPTREEREQAAAAVRAMQAALAPQVEALYETDAGMDVFEAFDHFGRAADALHYAFPGATGIALAELTAAAELLRNAAGRSTDIAILLTPIAAETETAVGNVSTWPVTHAGTKDKQAFSSDDARLVLTPCGPDEFVLTDGGVKVATFTAEGDALEAVAGYALPADDPAQGIPFNVFLAPEGYESGDGRMLELGTTTWRDPPLPLMMQDSASHGDGYAAPAWFAGAIERIWRDQADASRIIGRGHLAPGEDGQRAEAAIRAGLRGVSIDGIGQRPPEVQVTEVGEDGEPLTALYRYSDTRIMGATSVPHPAFEPCCIWFDDEPVPERVTMTHGQQIPNDAPAVADSAPLAALVASAGGPKNPPRAWFQVPPPDRYMAPTVTAEGQFMGHLGKAGTCHIGAVGRCETIPASATGYRYFHRTEAHCDDGSKVACGWLTMNAPHERNLHASAADAMSHYDHTGTQVAKIRITDTPNGPWACGAIAPGLSDELIWKLQGPEVSGDWRNIDGHYRELVAVLAVPLPGFLTERPEALVASGQIVAQIGTLPCDECGPPADLPDFNAARFIAALRRQNIANELAAGIEAGGPEVQAAIGRALAQVNRHRGEFEVWLRPTALAAIREKVSPPDLLEAARKAAGPDPAQEWRDRLRV